MARIYNPEQYGDNYQGSTQSRGFNPIAAVDTSNQERQRSKQQVANVNREIQIQQRDQQMESTVLKAQQSVARANMSATTTAVKGLLSLSQTALKAMDLEHKRQEEETNYNNQVEAEFNGPEEGYSIGEVSPKAQQAADSAAEFSEQQIAIGVATNEAAEGDEVISHELQLPAMKQGNAVNIQRQNAYQASKSVGVFLNEFMDSDVTITRPDGTTFTPATAETEADLNAALSIAKREFGAGAGIEKMNRAAVQRNLIPSTTTASNAILRDRGRKIREAQEQTALDNVNGTIIDGVLAGENPATLYEEAFAGLVGVGGRTKGEASKAALSGVLAAIVEDGSMSDFEELKTLKLATGHVLGKGVTGKMIRDAEDKFLDNVHTNNVRRDRINTQTLNGYKEDRFRELMEAGADPEKIRAIEEKYIGLAQELGGKDALTFEKSIRKGGTTDSTVAFDLLKDQAVNGDLNSSDIRDAFDAGVLTSTQVAELNKIVPDEAAELEKKVKPYEAEIKRLSKAVTSAKFGESGNLMGGSKDENASIEADITRTITNRVTEFVRLNPDVDPGKVSQHAERIRDGLLKDISEQQQAAQDQGIQYKYQYSGTTSLNAAMQKRYKDLRTGREVRDLTSLSTFDLQKAGFNNTDSRNDNDINPTTDRILGIKELEQFANLYRQGGEAALPDRVKVVAGAVGNMNPRVLLEQQGQAYGIDVNLKGYIREQQAKGLDPASLPKADSVEQRALDVIGTYESDSVGGYDAVNQYGDKGGHGTGSQLGMYSGRFSEMPQHNGRELSSMTLQEIMDLQSDTDGLSNDEWRDQGRLHAVGRYQFVGDTLAGIVRNSGIDPNTRFTPEVQDAMALYHLRTATSGIGEWVGPATYATMGEKEIVRAARLLESGNASKAQLIRIARMFS